MNILHLNTHLDLGGISSYLEILGKALVRRGHRVSVVSGGGSKIASFEKNGVRCFTLPIRTKSEIHPKLWSTVGAVSDIVRSQGIDILHAHTRVTEVLAAAVSRRTGVPFVTTAHGFYKRRFGRRLFPCWGERVVAISPLVAEELHRTHRVPKERIRVVSNALDLEELARRLQAQDRAESRRRFGISADAYVIGCVSRLVRDKGHEYLVRALEIAAKEIPSAHLLMVGDGVEKKNLERLVASLGLEKRVTMLAGVDDTTAVLCAMDVFVHPATYREGFGLAIAEALAAGRPVVLTRIPALDTLFTDGEDALIVPPKDAQALAEAVLRLGRDEALAGRLAMSGHAKVSASCRAERQAEEIESIYGEVLHGKGKKA